MSLGRIEKRLTAAALAAATLTALMAGSPKEARADGSVTATGKGITGGALLGAEAVCLTMGAVGVGKAWPYFVFGGVGAVGGAIGGYFVEKAAPPAEPSLYMLAGGLGLIIPTLVVSLNATAYKPPEGDRTEPATNEPAPEAPAPTPGATTRRDRRGPTLAQARPALPPHVPLSVLDVYKGKVAIGIPALELRPLYSSRELFQYRVTQGSEVRLPLFQAMF